MKFLEKIKKDKYLLGLIIILLIATIIKIFLLFEITTGHGQDDYWMISLGENFIDNFRYELIENQPYNNTQPVYPLLFGIFLYFFNFIFKNPNQTGALLSIIISLGIILLTYIFWSKIENKKVALLASFFIAFSFFSISYASLGLNANPLYTLLLLISLLFIYKSIEKEKLMPIAAIFITLSALTRWEGYLLIPVALFTLIISKRKEIFRKNKINFSYFKKDYFIISLLIILLPLFLWSLRSFNISGSWIPTYTYQQQLSSNEKTWQGGVNFFTGIPAYIPYYMIILIMGGLLCGLRKYKKYYPLFLYILFELFIHLKFRGRSGHLYYITPFLFGYASIFIFKLKEKIENKLKNG